MAGFANIQPIGRPLTIKDEGVSLNTNVGSINFTGSGVAGSAIGSDVTEDISGGLANSEIPVGVIDGVNTVFTVSNVPNEIWVNGLLMKGGGVDYTLSGGDLTITFVTAPPTNPPSEIKSFY